MLLDVKEREKFITWLEQEALNSNGMAEEMAKLGTMHEPMAKRLRTKATACTIIAEDLRRTESMSIGTVQQSNK